MRRGWGFKTGFPVGEGDGEGKKLVQYCNQWPAMLDFESVFDRGFQLLKYYFYVSVSFAGSVFSLGKLGRLVVSDEYVELFDSLCSFCINKVV